MLHGDIHAADHGIPRVYSCGAEDEYNYLVMDLMGPSLADITGISKHLCQEGMHLYPHIPPSKYLITSLERPEVR